MAQSSFPFENVDTTETQFSQMFRTLNAGVNGTPSGTELKVSAGTGLQVSVAAGQAMVRGHYYISSATELLTISTANATNPRIDTVVLRLDPVANSIVLAVVTGTAAASPSAPSLTQTDSGVYEFPLANVAVAAGAGTVGTITDRRVFMGKKMQSVGTSAARDIVFPAPVQGDQVWRDDLGATQTYFGLYNASTNPGGRDAAGWYITERSSALVPIKPTVATFVSGTGGVTSLGRLYTLTACSKVNVQGVFTAEFTSYRIVFHNFYEPAGNAPQLWIRLSNAGTDVTSSNYNWTRIGLGGGVNNTNGGAYSQPAAEISLAGNSNGGTVDMVISKPFVAAPTTYVANSFSGRDSLYQGINAGVLSTTASYDGFSIYLGGYNGIFSFSIEGIVE